MTTEDEFLTAALPLCRAAMERAASDGKDPLVALVKVAHDLATLARRICGDAAVDAWKQGVAKAVTEEALLWVDRAIDDMDLSGYGPLAQLALRRSLHRAFAQRIPGIVADALTNF